MAFDDIAIDKNKSSFKMATLAKNKTAIKSEIYNIQNFLN